MPGIRELQLKSQNRKVRKETVKHAKSFFADFAIPLRPFRLRALSHACPTGGQTSACLTVLLNQRPVPVWFLRRNHDCRCYAVARLKVQQAHALRRAA